MLPCYAERMVNRSSRPVRRARAEVLAESDVCVICGHRGSDSVDHIIPLSIRPDLADDKDNLGPAHHEPCPTCAQRCNNLKGTRPLSEVTALVTSRDWFTQSVRG
jgi:5-methylcytosine-specific restriction endonuclease McrA